MENKILSIEKTVEKIEKLLNSNVIEKAKKYDETIALLDKIDFQATSSIEVDEANGEKFVVQSKKVADVCHGGGTCRHDSGVCIVYFAEQRFFH